MGLSSFILIFLIWFPFLCSLVYSYSPLVILSLHLITIFLSARFQIILFFFMLLKLTSKETHRDNVMAAQWGNEISLTVPSSQLNDNLLNHAYYYLIEWLPNNPYKTRQAPLYLILLETLPEIETWSKFNSMPMRYIDYVKILEKK